MSGFVAGSMVGSMVVSTAIGAYAANKAASKASSASDRAAAAQKESTQANIDLQWKMFEDTKGELQPWTDAGKEALGKYQNMLEAGPGEFVPEEQPGYKFGFENFIEDPYLSGQSAKGKRLSGETAKGLTKYASDYAETSYDNFLNRYYSKMGQYGNLANMGQASAAKSATLSQQTGQNIGQNYMNMGNIQAQNAMNQGNIATQEMSAYAGLAQGASQNYLNYAMAQKMGVV